MAPASGFRGLSFLTFVFPNVIRLVVDLRVFRPPIEEGRPVGRDARSEVIVRLGPVGSSVFPSQVDEAGVFLQPHGTADRPP